MAYEVRISDWSSYVCSSDLAAGDMLGPRRLAAAERGVGDLFAQFVAQSAVMRGVGAEAFALRRKLRIENGRTHALALPCPTVAYPGPSMPTILLLTISNLFMTAAWSWHLTRSEERPVGKECVSTCRSRWSP